MHVFHVPITTIIIILLITILWKLIFTRTKHSSKLPPGPPPLPIIGNFHLLGRNPHRSLAQLAQKYGPIMSLRLGQIQTFVVSSPTYAEFVLKKHDHVLSGRPEHEAWVAGKKAMAFTPPGDYRRRVRQMCTQQLLGAAKIAEFEELRKSETLVSVRKLAAAAVAREVVNIDALVGELLENIIFTMVVGKGKEGAENIMLDLKDVIEESVSLAGKFNLGDYIPILRCLDLQGISRRFQVIKKKTDELFDKIIDDHLNQTNSEKQNDILHTVLDLTSNQTDKYFSNFNKENVKAITYEIFAGGIDTLKVVIVWALSLLIKNPRTLKTLQQEIDTIVGKQNMIKESDLAKLTYLEMVVKETLRLYPVGPLLVPHEAMDDVMIDGYLLPYKSRVIVNVWAIGHDRKIWSENVEEFYPERFMKDNVDMNGSNFKLIPFGSGRRGCPGRILGLVNVKFILAQLVHCFDWEVSGGIDEMDMTEKFGLTIPRVTSLLVIPSLRLQIPDAE